jgi:hypothetical protein
MHDDSAEAVADERNVSGGSSRTRSLICLAGVLDAGGDAE